MNGLTDDIATIVAQGPTVASSMATIIRRVNPYVGTVRRVVDDPAFPAVMDRVTLIIGSSSGGGGGGVSTTPGVGLVKTLPVLDAVIYAQRNPWLPWAALGAIVLVIGGIGYRMGRRK